MGQPKYIVQIMTTTITEVAVTANSREDAELVALSTDNQQHIVGESLSVVSVEEA